MNVSKLAPYAKAVVAICGAIVVTATCLSDGNLSVDDCVLIGSAWLTAFGVHKVPNKVG